MTFADKLIALRKRNGWSQETLAEKLDVSRQAVSKWESEQSVPDLERVVALSALFDVSTDYLLKDSSEEPSAFSETSAVHSVSMQEAVAFLQTRMSSAQRIAAGVTLCILSPVPLILLSVAVQTGKLAFSEPQAVGAGLIPLILAVGAAVALFVVSGVQTKPYASLETDPLRLDDGVCAAVRERRSSFQRAYLTQLVAGIVMCVVSVLPIFAVMILFGDGVNSEWAYGVAVALLLAIVAVGVFLILRAAIPQAGFSILLEEGDYARGVKAENKRNERLSAVYWCTVTAGFLAYSFITEDWQHSWIVWPVAGVLYGVVLACAAAVRKKEKD